MNVKNGVRMVSALVVLCAISGCDTKESVVERPMEQVVAKPILQPDFQATTDTELERLRGENQRLTQKLEEVNAKWATLTAEYASAQTQVTTLSEQAREANAKVETLTARHEAKANALHFWLTIASVAAVMGFFAGISLGTCTRREFYAEADAGNEGGCHESEEE